MMAGLIGLVLGAIIGVLSWWYDGRTPAEREQADRRKLGYAVGVPTLFDKRESQ